MRIANNRTRRLGLIGALIGSAALALASAAPAAAAPIWRLDVLANTAARAGEQLEYLAQVRNVGDSATNGSEIVVRATLPVGMTAVDATVAPNALASPGTVVPCTAGDGVSPVAGASDVRCANTTVMGPTAGSGSGAFQLVRLTVAVAGGQPEGTLSSAFELSGGGAARREAVEPTTISGEATQFGVDAFDGQVEDELGQPLTEAGGHPADAGVALTFNTVTDAVPLAGNIWPVDPVKDIVVELPAGLVGDPTSLDQCTAIELANSSGGEARPLCPPSSQMGTVLLRMNNLPLKAPVIGPIPIFNLVPPPGAPTRFGFNIFGTVVILDGTVRSGSDYGISVISRNVSEALPLAGVQTEFWGVPSDPSHRGERACPGNIAPGEGGSTCDSTAPRAAFLRNPTSCTAPGVGLATSVTASSWVNPDATVEASFDSHLPPGFPAPPQDWGPEQGTTDCDRVPFDPSFEAVPGSGAAAGKPTGFAFDLSLLQSDNPDVPSTSDLRKAVVTLPEGVRINPAAADGLGACPEADANLDSTEPADCPESAKIGSVQVDTPLLREPLQGSIYQAKPYDNPFNSLLALYVAVEGQGVEITLPAKVEADPNTGQLTTTFDDNPQAPFSNFHLEFKGGPRAPLAMPDACGEYEIQSTFTGWSGRVVDVTSPFTISNGCVAEGFAPKLSAGVERAIAGLTSPFVTRITREDSDQELSSIDIAPPPGLVAYLKGVPYGSQIGTVVTGAGAGTNPLYITDGKVTLEGPYKGAPLSLGFSVPTKAGPFDLGTVNVRAALHINRQTAQITADADPMPTILQGIPLDVRDVRINLDKPNFMLNPTSCDPMSVDSTIVSTKGSTANPSSHFQVSDCAALGFKPRMALRLFGKTRRGAYPKFRAILMPRRGDANASKVSVTLPPSQFLANNHIKAPCTRADFAADSCPRASIYGFAKAWSPLLDRPLSGPVYLKTSNNKLPDLAVSLRGPDYQPIRIDAIGRVDSIKFPNGNTGIRNTFTVVPDAPISKFMLTMKGGGKGLLQNSTNICKGTHRASVKMDAHNGRISDIRPKVKAACGKKGKRKKSKKHKRSNLAKRSMAG